MFYKLFFEIIFKEIFSSLKSFSNFKRNILLKENSKIQETFCISLSILVILFSLLVVYGIITQGFFIESIVYIFMLFLFFVLLLIVFIVLNSIFFIQERKITTIAQKILKEKHFSKKYNDFINDKKEIISILKNYLNVNYTKEIILFLIKNNFISKEDKNNIINSRDKWASYELLEEILSFIYLQNNKKSPKKDLKTLQQIKKALLVKLDNAMKLIDRRQNKYFLQEYFFILVDLYLPLLVLLSFLFVLFSFLFINNFLLYLLLQIVGFSYYNFISNKFIEKLFSMEIDFNKQETLNIILKDFYLLNEDEKNKILKELNLLNDKVINILQNKSLSIKNIEELMTLNYYYNDIFSDILFIESQKKENKEEKFKMKIEKIEKEFKEKEIFEEIKKI